METQSKTSTYGRRTKRTVEPETIQKCIMFLLGGLDEFDEPSPSMNFYYMFDVIQAIHTYKVDLEQSRVKYIWGRTRIIKNSTVLCTILRNLIALGLVEKSLGEKYGRHQIARYFLTEKGKQFFDIFQP